MLRNNPYKSNYYQDELTMPLLDKNISARMFAEILAGLDDVLPKPADFLKYFQLNY